MKERLRFFFVLSFYWMAFFSVSRALFFIYQFAQTTSLTPYEIFMPFLLGLRMDAAMTGYWMILPGLLFAASVFLSKKTVSIILGVITSILLLLSCIMVVADIELYKHWGFRLNATPLMYVGSEAAGSINIGVLITLLFIFVILSGSFLLLYLKKLSPAIEAFGVQKKRWAPLWLIITASLFIPIRSSFSVAPLNTGVVYFHKTKSFPNHAGINPVWNFLRSLSTDDHKKYPEDFYPAYEKDFTLLMSPRGDSTSQSQLILNKQKPNVILIILESFTAKIIEPLGGLPAITPELNALSKEGILFTNFYASGDRTDKGIVSILSGYPAQPTTSIIKHPEKTQSLSYLPKAIENIGYHTSFVYGGDIGFANMESYLTQAGFAHITEDEDFASDLNNSKWGVADHYVFNRLLTECDSAQNPFFKVMLSLSSHEPFEVPMEPVFKGNDESTLFLNSCFYTDKSLGNFIREAKKKEWWKNTLVIITADHGHRFPNPKELKEKERFKIPMLWLGGAIDKKEFSVNTLGMQTDIATTLLTQLDGNSKDFTFSRDILETGKTGFAIYIFNNGFGFISGQEENIYDFDLKNYLKKESNETELGKGNAYMQKLFHDYNLR